MPANKRAMPEMALLFIQFDGKIKTQREFPLS